MAIPVEVEVPRRAVQVVTASLACVGLIALALLGWANSPHDVGGRPLLLSPERREVLYYLEAAGAWAETLAEAGVSLDSLTPVEPPAPEDSSLPQLPAPEEQASDLYDRVRQARLARAALEDLAREVEQRRVPEAMAGLHSLVTRALEAHLAWAEAMLAHVGAPDSVDAAELGQLRADAHEALQTLEETLPDAR
jgi:hypothetical protein